MIPFLNYGNPKQRSQKATQGALQEQYIV